MSIACPTTRERARVERARRTVSNTIQRVESRHAGEWGLRSCLQRAVVELEHAEWWLDRIATTTESRTTA